MTLFQNKKALTVKPLPTLADPSDIDQVHGILDTWPKNPIDTENWEHYPDKPEVFFTPAWHGKILFLKFYVREPVTRAVFLKDNDPVYQDSCVEFFFSQPGEAVYYNLETNCIGTCLGESGFSRQGRTHLKEEVLSAVKRVPSLPRRPLEETHLSGGWTLLLEIPLDLFLEPEPENLAGVELMANFYKCGDSLSIPHYLSWSPINTKTPDFHRPEFFVPLRFASHQPGSK